jgi:hypothetical protein
MQRRGTLLHAVFGAARWVLPWLCVLVLSATLAYATDLALTGGHPVAAVPMATAAPTATDVTANFCTVASSPSQYVGDNSWIRVGPRPAEGCVPGQ